jgi:hypothetical protein
MAREITYISWLNNLGGFEYWPFVGYKDKLINVESTGEANKNIFPGWPKSYDSKADTITKQTFRRTRTQEMIRSQHLTRSQAERIGDEIRTSILVQKIVSRRDRRTVIVENSSATVRRGIDKIHNLSFNISYTDQIANQTV